MDKDLTLSELRQKYIDKRVKCISMNDDHPIPPQTEGTVISVDDIRTLHVKWDNGSMLGLIIDEDRFILV